MEVKLTDSFFKSLKNCFRPWWHPKELWYQTKCWLRRPYTTIKPRTLGHTWCDRDKLLAHMMFEILSQFIEKECSPGVVDWEGTDRRVDVVMPSGHVVNRNVRVEMQKLYDWWQQQYLKKYVAIEEALYAECTRLNKRHCTSLFRAAEERGMCVWDPQYDDPEAAARVERLHNALSALEARAVAALDRRLHRLINIRLSLWT